MYNLYALTYTKGQDKNIEKSMEPTSILIWQHDYHKLYVQLS